MMKPNVETPLTRGNHTMAARAIHDDVIKWKHFPRYWSFVRGIHRWPVSSPHKGQWRGALMFSLIWAWINGWVNNSESGDLRRHRAHYDVTVMPHQNGHWACIRSAKFVASYHMMRLYIYIYIYIYIYYSTYALIQGNNSHWAEPSRDCHYNALLPLTILYTVWLILSLTIMSKFNCWNGCQRTWMHSLHFKGLEW